MPIWPDDLGVSLVVGLILLFKLEQVEFFEPFWDSSEPRVGEKGARGWRAWMHQQERGGWVLVNPGECFQEVRGMPSLLGLGFPFMIVSL